MFFSEITAGSPCALMINLVVVSCRCSYFRESSQVNVAKILHSVCGKNQDFTLNNLGKCDIDCHRPLMGI